MKMRALILGSAHYMKEWVVKNKARFSDYLIFAMNNAWFLAPERAGVRVLNVGGQEESLLPFERAIF